MPDATAEEIARLVEALDQGRQAWILRTTQIFRRDGDRALRLHRHTDPLIRFRPLADTLAFADPR